MLELSQWAYFMCSIINTLNLSSAEFNWNIIPKDENVYLV